MNGPLAVLALALLATGCATTRYQPRIVARGELTLRYDDGFEMWAGGREVAHGVTWRGLREYVRCVPDAKRLASEARGHGDGALATSILGATFGLGALGGLSGLAVDDRDTRYAILGTGVGLAVTGLVFALVSQGLKNGANGRAVDSMNFYNDSVGSLGATCDDLTYPAPIAAEPPASP